MNGCPVELLQRTRGPSIVSPALQPGKQTVWGCRCSFPGTGGPSNVVPSPPVVPPFHSRPAGHGTFPRGVGSRYQLTTMGGSVDKIMAAMDQLADALIEKVFEAYERGREDGACESTADAVKSFKNGFKAGKYEGRKEGYEEGYNVGFMDGEKDYQEAIRDAYDDGYSEGYFDGEGATTYTGGAGT